MPTNIAGRLTAIIGILIVALIAIWPPGADRLNLKRGIDMVGGTSLTYEIKPPPGGAVSPDLAISVMESLKKRVDPDGVRNLIWRPQGSRQLEIQMPASDKAGESRALREAYADAQRKLEATNVRSSEVIRTVERMKGADRDNRLKQLAMDSATRQKLFADLARTYDQIQAASAKGDVAAQGDLELQYDKLKNQIDDTNVTTVSLESTLGLNQQARDQKVNELRERFKDFPSRLAGLDQFIKAYGEFGKVKGQLDDAADLKRLLQGSGVLEFHILADLDPSNPEVKAMMDRLQKQGPIVQGGDTMRWVQLDNPEELKGNSVTYNDKQWALVSTLPSQSMTKQMSPPWALQDAHPILDQGERKVGFLFDAQGAVYFGELSGNNVGKALAIVLDDKLISAPVLRSRIGARGEISGGEGGFSAKEVDYLVRTLDAGSLPARLADEPISERTVGPQLGADNLRRGLWSCAVGLVIVAIFLIGYYYLSGVVAFIAVLMNLVLILGTMAAFNATFTLPGIAGIVLTVGAAVDANVLIFERLREEQQRGLSLRMAMRNAYDRAWSAIIDSNATTLATSLFLYWFGSEEVKGFGLTLLIGLIWSLFTSLFVTRTIFAILIDKFHVTKLGSLPLTFPKWDEMLRPDIRWMSKAWIFGTVSAIIVVVGMSAFIAKARTREIADIEFASGTSVQLELKHPMRIDEVRKLVTAPQFEKELPAPGIVSIGTQTEENGRKGHKEYEIVTPNAESNKVKEAVLTALGQNLKIDLPSRFQGVEQPIAQAVDAQHVLPIREGQELVVSGWSPPSAERYVGGAAIVLKDLNPPLSANDIRARIERQRVQPQAQSSGTTYRDYVVETPARPDEPVTTAVILTVDPNVPFEKDENRWRDEVAGSMWTLANDAINRPPQLQRVSSFDASVAGAARDDALIALALSIAVIMAYVWLRFGNLKYGTATVVAMLHDTLMVLGFIGLSHYLVYLAPALANGLLLEPFRINLTIVAAVLTVMSYSMMDTIVVFDRIRENRGKFGLVNAKIIDDSINQTLSRTLLTGGTNIATILYMYIAGGPGIHGFTFVLLTGMIIGTYSSIAIAAPILLVGGEKEPGAGDGAARKAAEKVAADRAAGQLQRA